MKYKHKVTGAVVITNSKISGNWELVEEKKTTTKKAPKKSVKK